MLEKQNLLGLTQEQFKKFFSDLDEKPFRTKQIMQWIYHQGVYYLELILQHERFVGLHFECKIYQRMNMYHVHYSEEYKLACIEI